LRSGTGIALMSTLCHKRLHFASYIIYGNALMALRRLLFTLQPLTFNLQPSTFNLQPSIFNTLALFQSVLLIPKDLLALFLVFQFVEKSPVLNFGS